MRTYVFEIKYQNNAVVNYVLFTEKEDEDEPPHLRKVGFDEQSDIIDP